MKTLLHNMKYNLKHLIVSLLLTGACTIASAQQLRVVIAGLSHDHIHGILRQFNNGKVNVVGIAEPDKQLQLKYSKQYHLPDSLFANDLKELLMAKKPDAVLGYNAVAEHVAIVRICAPLGIPVMVEKDRKSVV